MLQVMANPVDEEVREGTNEFSMYFVIAGVAVGISNFVQVSQQQVIVMKSVLFPSQTLQCISLLQVLFLQSYVSP